MKSYQLFYNPRRQFNEEYLAEQLKEVGVRQKDIAVISNSKCLILVDKHQQAKVDKIISSLDDWEQNCF